MLRCDSVLQKNPFVVAVPSSSLKRCKKKSKKDSEAKDASQDGSKVSNCARIEWLTFYALMDSVELIVFVFFVLGWCCFGF